MYIAIISNLMTSLSVVSELLHDVTLMSLYHQVNLAV